MKGLHHSEEKQIPLIVGDLSKPFVNVNSSVLTALKIQKAKDRPALARVNPKGMEEKYIDSLKPDGKKIYLSFQKTWQIKNLSGQKIQMP
ncbi:MAG: hypothetical protein IPK57_12835 [Chitinophagaceae bacterium]|nr:hypothetical protein [Chitinophagaceae bacterium]